MRRNHRSSFSFFVALALLVFSSPAIAAKARNAARKGRPGRVQTGLDFLEIQKFTPLKGKHVGLITNHTGLDAQEKTTIDRLAHAPGVTLVALFSPEHGLAGKMDDKVTSTKDPSTGLPVYSLYGETKRPTDEMLNGIDALVFDIQDAGVRFYTYTTTMGYCMEAAAKKGIAFYVLDRPNPIGGDIVEGPMLDDDKRDFVAYFPLPVRYALTIGELAQLYNVENKIGSDLHVIQMKNWHRNYFYDSTGLRWVPPSPNLRTTKGAILYPGLEILQNAGISVGRGTEAPFEVFGAPWMNGGDVASALNAKHLPGLKFVAQLLIPVSGLYAGQRCGGVSIKIGEKSAVRSIRMGLEIAAVLKKLYPDKVDLAKTITLLGNAATVEELRIGAPPEKIVADWKDDLAAYEKTRRKYILYK